jgi:hypothetical protein
MYGVGFGELLIVALPLALVLGVSVWLGRRARRAGYAKTLAYLRAAPRTDQEKRDAVELALQGLVLCLLGVVVSPLVFVGIAPLYFGARKVALAWLGLELADPPAQ